MKQSKFYETPVSTEWTKEFIMEPKARSGFLNLNLRDFIRGLIVATGTAFGTGLIAVLQNGTIPQSGDYRTMGISAAAAGVAYLVKNLFTNSNGEIAKKEQQ